MRFRRFPRHRNAEVTPRRLAAAARHIRKQLDAVPLFPEMVRVTDPVQRIAEHEAGFTTYWQELRDSRAASWRNARAAFFALPAELRRDLMQRWSTCGWPGDGTYFSTWLQKHAR